jgi:hypothetical protein
MRATKISRDDRRAQRWLTRSGMPGPISPAAWDLLAPRLSVHARTTRMLIALVAVVVAAWVPLVMWGQLGPAGDPRWSDEFATRWFVLLVIVDLLALAAKEVNARADRALARSLAHRVTRAEAVPLRVILGRVRSAFLVSAVTLDAAIAIAISFVHAGWLGWGYPIAVLVAGAIVAVGIARDRARPTIAVDPVSLAIDERQRAQDVFLNLQQLVYLPMIALPALSASAKPTLWLVPLMLGIFSVLVALSAWAGSSPPWGQRPKTSLPPTPLPEAVSR